MKNRRASKWVDPADFVDLARFAAEPIVIVCIRDIVTSIHVRHYVVAQLRVDVTHRFRKSVHQLLDVLGMLADVFRREAHALASQM